MCSSAKFLLFHQGAIGDFILALPSFESIHTKFPSASFTLIASETNASLIENRCYLKSVISKDRGDIACLFLENSKLGATRFLLGGPFEKAFIFGQSMISTVASNIKRLGTDIVYKIKSYPDPLTPQMVTNFIYEQFLSQGLQLTRQRAQIDPDPKKAKLEQDFIYGLKHRFKSLIALHPGSGSLKNVWPIPYWKTIINQLSQTAIIGILLILGPADGLVYRKLKGFKNLNNLLIIKEWSLPKLVSLLKQVSLFIGSDSGITHLAAVLGIPTLAIFGHSDPAIWAPQGPLVKIIKTTWTIENNSDSKLVCNLEDLPEGIIQIIRTISSKSSVETIFT